MIREILKVPDPRLVQVCDVVRPEFQSTDILRDLIRDLFDTCKANNGAGLAAPQIGVMLRVFVIDAHGTRLAFVNPEIVKTSPDKILDREACLSIPGVEVTVWRYARIEVKERGHRLKFRGLAARAIQHELDHLDGKLIVMPGDLKDE